jgi:hypothetical protein
VYKLSPLLAYDKHPLKSGIVLDLPFNESSGAVTHDISKAHHRLAAGGAPAWSNLPSGVPVTILNGLTDYWDSPAAETVDLNFTTGDYSLACWLNWEDTGIAGEIVMGRYELNVSGWELYLAWNGAVNSLTLRHHHAGTLVGGNPRSACYSVGWERGVWCLLGVSRVGGGEAIHYRNGVPLTMVTGGLADPESCAKDLVIGARYTKNATFYEGSLKNMRAWNRALTAVEWATLFELERDEVGV